MEGLSSELRVGGRVLDSTEESVFSPRLKFQLGFPGPGAPATLPVSLSIAPNLPPHAGKSESSRSQPTASGFLLSLPFFLLGHGPWIP